MGKLLFICLPLILIAQTSMLIAGEKGGNATDPKNSREILSSDYEYPGECPLSVEEHVCSAIERSLRTKGVILTSEGFFFGATWEHAKFYRDCCSK